VRRTKIVATVGPASGADETLEAMIVAGVDVFRLNFSHGSQEEHARHVAAIRAAGERAGKEVAVMGDLPGPKIRLGELDGGALDLLSAEDVTLTEADVVGSRGLIPVAFPEFSAAVPPRGHVFVADGRVRLRVREVSAGEVRCTVEHGGRVRSRQGVNLPGAGLPAAGRGDGAWLDFAVEHGVDLIAVSFVREPADIEAVVRRLRARGADLPVLAKLERVEATARVEEIVELGDVGVMVARGDLGIEIELERLPVVQRRLLRVAGSHARASITATQMLASMVDSPRPTRAEVTDVANAIYQGTDAVMLSDETAIGAHPVEAVRVMDRIALATERDLPYREWARGRVKDEPGEIGRAVAGAAVGSAHKLGLAALVVPTESGRSARLVSAYRPSMPVLAISRRREIVRRLNLMWGVRGVVAEEDEGLPDLLGDCARIAREAGVARRGELIGITAGLPGHGLGTNLFEIHRVD
jgi:pyruvate kinase